MACFLPIPDISQFNKYPLLHQTMVTKIYQTPHYANRSHTRKRTMVFGAIRGIPVINTSRPMRGTSRSLQELMEKLFIWLLPASVEGEAEFLQSEDTLKLQ